MPNVKKYQTRGPCLEDILIDVAEVFEVSYVMLKSRCKKRSYLTYRQIYMFASKAMTNATLSDIGDVVGKDHTNCIYHINNCKIWIDTDDRVFMRLWDKYQRESKIWSQYVNRQSAYR